MKIADACAVVTGGASGLGYAVAAHIVRAGGRDGETIRLDGAIRMRPK